MVENKKYNCWNSEKPVLKKPEVLWVRQGNEVWLTSVWLEDSRVFGLDQSESQILLTRPDEPFPVFWDDVCDDEPGYEWRPWRPGLVKLNIEK